MGQSPSRVDKPVPPEENSSRSSRDLTNLSYLSRSSSSTLHEELNPSHQPVSSNEQPEWNAWTWEGSAQETTFPPNPFTHGSPIRADIKPKNVILFGETGVGKSSVINLMADSKVAKTSPNLESCTLQSTEYSFVLAGETPFRIYDTVGLNEPSMRADNLFGALEKAHQLVTSLHDAGGIDLLIFCIRGGRITETVQNNYRLFFEFLGAKQIPVAVVVTHLELEERMEEWWERNEQAFREYEIYSVAHACITAAPPHVTTFAEKRRESRWALQRMLQDAFSNPSFPHVEDVPNWFIRVAEFFRSILRKNSWFRKKELTQMFETRYSFAPDKAQELADIFVRGK